MSKHIGYANGAKTITREVVESAFERLLSETTREEKQNQDGTTTVKVRHETDPPDGFVHPRMRKPGPLPSFIKFDDVKAGNVLTHEHTLNVSSDDDLDVWCYHFARHVVTEARRVHGKAVSVKSVTNDKDGVVLITTVTIK